MAKMDVFHEINILVPLRAVVGQDDVLLGCRLGWGHVRRQRDFGNVPLQPLNGFAAGGKLLQMVGKVPAGLGVGLGFLADKLRETTLVAVGIMPKRYAELERTPAFVSAITITPIAKNNG